MRLNSQMICHTIQISQFEFFYNLLNASIQYLELLRVRISAKFLDDFRVYRQQTNSYTFALITRINFILLSVSFHHQVGRIATDYEFYLQCHMLKGLPWDVDNYKIGEEFSTFTESKVLLSCSQRPPLYHVSNKFNPVHLLVIVSLWSF
jgi:hypothetical protein